VPSSTVARGKRRKGQTQDHSAGKGKKKKPQGIVTASIKEGGRDSREEARNQTHGKGEKENGEVSGVIENSKAAALSKCRHRQKGGGVKKLYGEGGGNCDLDEKGKRPEGKKNPLDEDRPYININRKPEPGRRGGKLGPARKEERSARSKS